MSSDPTRENPTGTLPRLFSALEVPLDGRTLTDEEAFRLIELQIGYLLKHRRDWLLGKLYRLDVRERDIKAALATCASNEVAAALTNLVFARQRERAATRQRYGAQSKDALPEDLKDLSW